MTHDTRKKNENETGAAPVAVATAATDAAVAVVGRTVEAATAAAAVCQKRERYYTGRHPPRPISSVSLT